MKGFDILKVKSAVKARNKFDLGFSHLTTMNFGEIVPLLSEETVPGDKFNIGSNFFSRMAPLVKPTYGKFSFKTVTAFVPYHQIADDADAWLAGKTTWEGITPKHRFITAYDLINFLYSNTDSTSVVGEASYSYINSSGNATYRKFTNRGRYYFKVLNSLGYAIPQGVDQQSGSYWETTGKNVKYSAYPLLAFFKLYNDYMSQSQRYNTSPLSAFLTSVKHCSSISGFNPSNGQVNSVGLSTLFSNLFLNYENDYFTSAWQNPTNPLQSLDYVNSLRIPGESANVLAYHGTEDVQLNVPVLSGITGIGQRALDFLKDFDDWVRRNNYSGSRSVQQLYSRFGIKTDDYRSNYAHVYKTDVLPVQVGDVTATGPAKIDGSEVGLGDYSGKGIMSGSNGVSIDVDDYGMIFILGYFTVSPMMSYGFDRSVLRISPLDYYNPEFDGIGGEAISLGEVYSSPIAVTDGDTTTDSDVYGFTERYNSYRYGRDKITGEFRDYHSNGDMNVWHTGRNLSSIRKAGSLVAQSSSMNTLPQSDSEYNRIFSITSGIVDHFYLTAKFDVSAIRPMLNLNQVVKLGEGDTVVPRNGNVIS